MQGIYIIIILLSLQAASPPWDCPGKEVCMPVVNGVVAAPVDFETAVGQALGLGKPFDCGTLCLSDKINPNARYKPVRLSKFEQLAESDFVNTHYGFNMEPLIPTTIDNISNKSAYYVRPDSYYRVTDFYGYKHASPVVCDISMPDSLIPNGDNVIMINNIIYNASDSHDLDINTIIGNGSQNMLCVVLGYGSNIYFRTFPNASQQIHLLLLNDDLDWDKIGLIVKIAAFFVDRNFVNNPNGWHNGLDYGMSAYPIITTKDYNNPASKQYALSSQPIPGASQYYVVGSTSLRVDTSSSYFTVDFIVHDRASAGISTLKNNNVPLVEALNWDGTMRYADYWEYSVTSTGTANEYNLRCGIAIPVNATSGKISYATVYLKNKNSGVIAKMVNVMIVSI